MWREEAAFIHHLHEAGDQLATFFPGHAEGYEAEIGDLLRSVERALHD